MNRFLQYISRAIVHGKTGIRTGIWYHPDYRLHSISRTARSSLVDDERAERILSLLLDKKIIFPEEIRGCEPLGFQDLLRVHTQSWLDDALKPEILAHVFGLDPSEIQPEDILSSQRRAAGGTAAAARAASSGEVDTGFSLGGGFHHAAPEQGAGSCVINDVAASIELLRAEGFSRPVAVIDLDYHQGDGTMLCFAKDPSVLTLSIHGSVWSRTEAVSDIGLLLSAGVKDEEYIDALTRIILPAMYRHRPGLVFYIAGNDVLEGDRLGAFSISPRGVLKRDKIVARACRKQDIPLVITLGGGYSEAAWSVSAAFLSWLLTGRSIRIRDTKTKKYSLGHYERIARSLDPASLQRDDGLGLSMEDILGDLSSRRRQKFLDFYSSQGLELALERYGFMDKVRALGFKNLKIEVNTEDHKRHILRLRANHDQSENKLHLLMEIVLIIRELCHESTDKPFRVLSLEWLLLQNPLLEFSLERPRLPGQDHPGLGLAHVVIALLVQVCRRISLHGIVNRPGYYHIAFVGAPEMKFLDPKVQGKFLAMQKIFEETDLFEATNAVDAKKLRLAKGETVPWEPADFVLPVSEKLRAVFETEEYRTLSETARDRLLKEELHVSNDPK